MRIKVCGLTRYEDAALAASLGADLLGFVFAPSPRRIAVDAAAAVIARLRREGLLRRARPVGVFVNTPAAEMVQIGRKCGLELLQIHGDETPETCAQIPALWFRALRVGEGQEPLPDPSLWTCPLLLVDAAVKGLYGGTGAQVPVDAACRIREQVRRAGKSFFLAGGLRPEPELLQLVRQVQPDGIDLSSGLESSPGEKSAEKLHRLFALLR